MLPSDPLAREIRTTGKGSRGRCTRRTLPPDKSLRSQVPIYVSTLARTSDPFRSRWRLGPNHTSRMRKGSVTSAEGSRQCNATLQAPSHWPSLLSKLILTPATSSYLSTTFFTAFMSARRYTMTVISSTYAKTFALRPPVKGTLLRAWFAAQTLNLCIRGSKDPITH